MVALFLIVALALSGSVTNVARADVWETSSNWNARAESAYQAWVTTKWQKNFFKKPGFYQNIAMDCADTVYAMRLVYAAENGLPFAMKDPTGGGGIISNEMTRWDHLPPDLRKREFLKFVYKIASTSSLPNDSYPVAVNRAAIGAGRFLLTDKASHHSWTIKSLSEHGVPFLLFASRPARIGLFERFEYPTVPFVFPNGIKPETHAGFRAFRHPRDLGKAVWQVPGYSLEQYTIPHKNWASQMQKRLALKSEGADQKLMRILANACQGAVERIDAVKRGDEINRSLGGACMTSIQFDDHSTPSRDSRLKGSFIELRDSYRRYLRNGKRISPRVRAQVEAVLAGDEGVDQDDFCPVQIERRTTLTLGQVYVRSLNDMMSADPHDSIAQRWGLQRFPSSKANSCRHFR